MYVEVPNNLADFDGYAPFSLNETKSKKVNYSSWNGSKNKLKPLCDTSRKFIRPIIAQDINGSWYLIVQTDLYHQQIPIEICSNPGGNCNAKCGHKARCIQRFHTKLLISINMDKEKECPMMKLFRFPSACVCDSSKYQ